MQTIQNQKVLQYQSEYADLPPISSGAQTTASDRLPVGSTSSSSTQPTPVPAAPAPTEVSYDTTGDVVMAHEDPVVSYDIDDLHAETPVAHDAIHSPDISYSHRDTGPGIGALYENFINGPTVDPNVPLFGR